MRTLFSQIYLLANSGSTTILPPHLHVVLLAGGVGGARLAAGLAHWLPANKLTVVVNTGDDFQHAGLTICPDLDTVMYTLAGVVNEETGWGRAGDTWRVMVEIGRFQGPDWFRLGDQDLATHLTRTYLLNEGQALTAVTRHLAQQMGVAIPLLPMSDKPAPTMIETNAGVLPFQTWFVKERWQPPVKKVLLPDDARASNAVARACQTADLIIIAPSNPFVSIDPILNCYPIRAMMMDLPQAVIAVSPIVGGTAVKGPAAKMMQEIGLPVTPTAVADYYGDLIDGFVYDQQDAGAMDNHTLPTLCTDTMMVDEAARVRVARELLTFAAHLMENEEI